jgi:hypothetical protein
MAQFYTLDEAAQRLSMPTDEFKRKLKTEWTSIRPFRDGATLRFRAVDIDELARSLGAASDPGLVLGPQGVALSEGSDEFGTSSDEFTPTTSGSGEDIFSVQQGDPGGKLKSQKRPNDSDVKLESSTQRGGEGSSVTEDLAIDLSGPSSGRTKSGSSGKLTAPKSGSKLSSSESSRIPGATGGEPAGTDSSSEFELSLDSDSDSFELQLTSDSSDEVNLGAYDPTVAKSGQSGINLGKPSDSGVSLEGRDSGSIPSKPPAREDDSDVDFELSLDAGSGASGIGLGMPAAGSSKYTGEDSSSEFELTLDDNSGVADALASQLQSDRGGNQSEGDIFETDFELPAITDESGSEVVGIDSDVDDSGFEVDLNEMEAADDTSASEVVVVDDDAVLIDDEAAILTDEDEALVEVDDERGSASRALRGVSRDDDEVTTVRAPVAVPWGPLPAALLLPALLFVFLGGLMSYEVLRGMWGYHSPTQPANALVRGVADMFGMKVTD